MSRLTRVIAKFASPGTGAGGAYVVTRVGAAVIGSDGRAAAPATTTFPVAASVQPNTGRDLMPLPEGFRGQETRLMYTTTYLRSVVKDGSPDYVTLGEDGRAWTVVNVKDWFAFGGRHYVALVARQGIP